MLISPLVEKIKTVTEELVEIEKEILLRKNIQSPEYVSSLTELKSVTDDLRTSIWCSLLPQVNTPEEVKKVLNQHRMKRVFEMLKKMLPESDAFDVCAEMTIDPGQFTSAAKFAAARH
jgi:hypothetical protein